MDFEFDPDKGASHREKHGIDFSEAQELWDDPNYVTFEARFEDESRFGIIAVLKAKLWRAIFTLRDEKIRLISVRRARDYETNVYHES